MFIYSMHRLIGFEKYMYFLIKLNIKHEAVNSCSMQCTVASCDEVNCNASLLFNHSLAHIIRTLLPRLLIGEEKSVATNHDLSPSFSLFDLGVYPSRSHFSSMARRTNALNGIGYSRLSQYSTTSSLKSGGKLKVRLTNFSFAGFRFLFTYIPIRIMTTVA